MRGIPVGAPFGGRDRLAGVPQSLHCKDRPVQPLPGSGVCIEARSTPLRHAGLPGRNTAAALLHRVDRSGAGRLLLF